MTRLFSTIFLNTLDFANVPSSHSLELLHKMVVENGGTFSMNLNNSVTHCIAAESKGHPLSLSSHTHHTHTHTHTWAFRSANDMQVSAFTLE